MAILRLLAAAWLFLSLSFAYGAGPVVVAKADRQLWQGAVNTPDSFDKASRAAVLVYVSSLQDSRQLTDSDMLAAFKIKSLNRAYIKQWIDQELTLALHNYQAAGKSCVDEDWTCAGTITTADDLVKQARAWQKKIPSALSPWQQNFTTFTRVYIAEQLRLAALFPKVSSEIGRFNGNEWNGDSFADRQFLLTFDDGPSNPQGNTDDVLAMLAANNKTAVFFVLGENLQNRLHKANAKTIAALYKHQCLALHGWEHQSHAKWANWQASVKRTKSLVLTTFAPQDPDATGSFLPLFRPPYGQRKSDSGDFFKAQGLQVALWNLDSQDWNSQVDSNDMANRLLALMLVKRRGVLLFHDVHPKAKTALPLIFEGLGTAVIWRDCHQL
ncbi:MAG: polysaccharide deacetylase family protein [Methylococcales bacterium]|nr:polysaccharide deacetylase family protein [Methylococcales bacterium]